MDADSSDACNLDATGQPQGPPGTAQRRAIPRRGVARWGRRAGLGRSWDSSEAGIQRTADDAAHGRSGCAAGHIAREGCSLIAPRQRSERRRYRIDALGTSSRKASSVTLLPLLGPSRADDDRRNGDFYARLYERGDGRTGPESSDEGCRCFCEDVAGARAGCASRVATHGN